MGQIWRKTALPQKKPTENAIKALSEDLMAKDEQIADADELIAQLIEENMLLKADLAEQIGDLQELTAEIIEGGI